MDRPPNPLQRSRSLRPQRPGPRPRHHQRIHLPQLPHARAGVHILGVSKDILAGAGADPGDTVQVELAFDDTPRTVAVPADLEAALAKSLAVSGSFAALSYSHKKEYVDWVDSAQKPETRQKCIGKAAEMLATRKTPKR
jgi:hypothetical protein